MIPLFKVYMSDDVIDPLKDILASGYIGQGPKVDEFEAQLKNYFGVDYVSTVNSCTSAIHLAVHLIRELPGDEILTTPLTCLATNFAILANNVKLKWVDVDLNNGNVLLDDLERKLSKNTKAIVVVHWSGYAVDLDRLKEIQNKCKTLYGHVPPIIEDCAHAWGSEYNNKLIGTHGNFCAYSFQAIKHLTTGDGGLLICPSNEYHKRAKLLRWFGLDREGSADFRCGQNVQEWGYKFHMNDISAQIGMSNFDASLDNVKKHRANSEFFDQELKNIPGITLFENEANRKSAAWIYTMRVERRDDFKRLMHDHQIHVSQVHARNDTHDCLKEFKIPLPNMDVLNEDMICIPCGWWVSNEDRQYIVDTIKKGW